MFSRVNLARLIIYYKDNQFITSHRNELYGYADFLGNFLYINLLAMEFMCQCNLLVKLLNFNITQYGHKILKTTEAQLPSGFRHIM